MKRTVLNLGAIAIAFVMGLAINNACADSLGQVSDSELRNLVSRLQQEVNTLKQKVTELESKLNNSSGHTSNTDSGFEVDGIHFSKNGFPDSVIDKSVQTYYYIRNGQQSESVTSTFNYEYDSKGRIQIAGEQKYSYYDKSYKVTSETGDNDYLLHNEVTYYLK